VTYLAEVLADSPFIYWRMGDPPIHDAGLHAGNSAYDLVVINGPLGAITGALGDASGARHFDGVDDQAQLVGVNLALPSTGNPLTVEFFINPDAYGASDDREALEIAANGGGAWWSGGGGVNIDMEPSAAGEGTKISFGMHLGGFLHRAIIDRSLIPVGQWTHVVVVYTADILLAEADRVKVYINGVRQTVGFGADTDANPTSSGNFSADAIITLMGRPGTTALDFPGGLDEFAIYKTELSPTRIAAHFAAVSGPPAPTNTVAPAVTGTAQTGQTLTCSQGTWSNSPTSFAFQWQRDPGTGFVNISGATASTYTLISADEGHPIRCAVTATNAGGSTTANSNSVTPTAPAAGVPVNTVAPAITSDGSPQNGESVSCSQGTWTNSPISFSYQWRRDGVNISSATLSTYTLQSADVGHAITCQVTATNVSGSSSATSAAITPTAAPAAPVNTATPVISGGSTTGSLLSSTTGTWTGVPTPTYAYRWQRDGVNITGATSSSYTLSSADEGHVIRCAVTATNTSGSATANSNTITGAPQPSTVATRGAKMNLDVGGTWIGLKLPPNVDNNEFAFDDYDDGVDSAAAFRAMIADGVANATDRETFHSKYLLSARNHVFDSAPVKQGPSYGWGIIPPFPDTGMKYILDFDGGVADMGAWNHWNQTVAQKAGCTIECPYTTTTPDVTYQSTPAIVCGPMQTSMFAAAGITSGFSNCLINWRGIGIVAPHDAGTIGLHLFRVAQAAVDNFSYHAQQTRAYMDAHHPANDQTIALLLPIMNNNDYVRVGSVGVQGAYWGMNLCDHLAMSRGGFIFCRKALYLPGIGGGHYHGASILNLSVEACETVLDANMAGAGGRFPLFIGQVNCELEYPDPTNGTADIMDQNNVLRGVINWTEDTDLPPTKIGATKIAINDWYSSNGGIPAQVIVSATAPDPNTTNANTLWVESPDGGTTITGLHVAVPS
jgi:hypothetical protein